MATNEALKLFERVRSTLDKAHLHYDIDEEKLCIMLEMRGEDLPIKIYFFVDPERELLKLISPMGFNFPENLRLEGAIAANYINDMLVDGSFDYDYTDGSCMFRATSSFRGSLISEKLILYMVGFSSSLVDDFNDKLMALAKGMIDLDGFRKQLAILRNR